MNYQFRKGKSQSPYYEVRFRIEGKRYMRSTKTAVKRAADKNAREIISELLAEKKYPKTLGSQSLNQAIESRADELSKNERLNVERVRKLNPALFNQPMATISTDDLWQLKLKMAKRKTNRGTPIKGQSVNRAFKFVYSTFERAKEWGWIDYSPHQRKLKEVPPEPREALTDEDIKNLKETCMQVGDTSLWWILCTYLNTGLRRSELCNLKREHVVYGGDAILLPNQKNGEFNQEFIINDVAKDIILKQLKGHNREYVFDFTNFRKRFEKVFAEGELDTDIHSLRHTAITKVAIACANLVELQTFSRHKSLSAMQRYIHLVDRENLRRIANLSKID